MKTIVRETTWLNGIPHGWGNGYVIVKKDNPLYGHDYDSELLNTISVHGGLTFSESVSNLSWPELVGLEVEFKNGWVFGFDTAHYNDTQSNCDKNYVINQTERLREQLEELTLTLK